MENKKRRREEKQPKPVVSEDLVIDIISRLPATDLVRFTCVSKSWCSLICTDPYLRRLQTERTASPHRPFLLIGRMSFETRSRPRLYHNYWVDLESIIQGHTTPITEIINPFDGDDDQPRRDARVMGSCHGLLLQQQQPSLKMAVSNPTTKTHVTVPPNPAGEVVFCGLGYDRVHDCYKLVTKLVNRLELMVYDLHKGTWGSLPCGSWWKSQCDELRAVGRLALRSDGQLNYTWNASTVKCVDGCVYWCIDSEETEREMVTMVCFLIAEEEFHIVKPPDLGEVRFYPGMIVLDERLGLVCSSFEYDGHEVWRTTDMDYDGDSKRQWRWTKLFAISDPSHYFTVRGTMVPVYFSASKNKVLIRVGFDRLFWYDITKKEFSKLNNPINNLGDVWSARSCVSRMEDFGFLFKNMLRPSQQSFVSLKSHN